MKAYGSKRHEHIACKQGCCTMRWHKNYPNRCIYDRARRKTARQEGKQESLTEY